MGVDHVIGVSQSGTTGSRCKTLQSAISLWQIGQHAIHVSQQVVLHGVYHNAMLLYVDDFLLDQAPGKSSSLHHEA